MVALPDDPQPRGDDKFPMRMSIFHGIVEVHFGGGPVVVAEVPSRIMRLRSLDPLDPVIPDFEGFPNDPDLVDAQFYDINQEIPKADYRSKLRNTTANTYLNNSTLDTIANTAGLTVGKDYAISGAGIPTGSTLTYNGASSGTLSQAATLTDTGVPVVITLPIWRFQPFLTGGLHTVEYWAIVDSGDETYFHSPEVRLQPYDPLHPEVDIAAIIEDTLADLSDQGYPDDFFVVTNSLDPDLPNVTYNGAILFGTGFGLPPSSGFVAAWIFQVKFFEAELSNVFLVNMATTKLVEVDQLISDDPFHSDQTGAFIPGYLPGNGVRLTAYSGTTEFHLTQVSTRMGFSSEMIVNAIDPTTEDYAIPLWSLLISPTDPPPDAITHVKQFDRNGLYVPPPP